MSLWENFRFGITSFSTVSIGWSVGGVYMRQKLKKNYFRTMRENITVLLLIWEG
jgi:hypothetical protein